MEGNYGNRSYGKRATETGEKEKELGIDVLRVNMVFYIKSHGSLCAGFLFAVSWSFGWFSRFSRRNN